MKRIIGFLLMGLLLGFAVHGKAYADYDGWGDDAPSYTYDYSSGNSYVYTPYSWGGGYLQGWNAGDGSQWNTTYEPSGDMYGQDSDGDYWQYNESTGNYWNSDGTSCSGFGDYRTCW